MKNEVWSSSWFPVNNDAIATRLKGQVPRASMLVFGLELKSRYRVEAGDVLIHESDRLSSAQAAQDHFEAQRIAEELEPYNAPESVLLQQLEPLPADQFVFSRAADGSVTLIRGMDRTDRCLLLVGADGRDFGYSGAQLDRDRTNADVLVHFATHEQVEVAAVLERGQAVCFSLSGGLGRPLIGYRWNGRHIDRFVSPELTSFVIPTPFETAI